LELPDFRQAVFIFTGMNLQQMPIGIFDSGVGGTSIWKEINKLLPHENTIYLADSRHAPYGEKPPAEIVRLSIKNSQELIDRGCKIIVVACNTATTNAIAVLRATFDLPFIGIEPAIKPAALNTQTKAVGILATRGTLSSELFNRTSDSFAGDVNVIEIVGSGLVPLIERGALESKELRALLEKYMEPMVNANIDYLVLGCSHYPYLIPLLKEILPATVTIIDSGAAVARQTAEVLGRNDLLQKDNTTPRLQFFSNGSVGTLENLLADYKGYIEIKRGDF